MKLNKIKSIVVFLIIICLIGCQRVGGGRSRRAVTATDVMLVIGIGIACFLLAYCGGRYVAPYCIDKCSQKKNQFNDFINQKQQQVQRSQKLWDPLVIASTIKQLRNKQWLIKQFNKNCYKAVQYKKQLTQKQNQKRSYKEYQGGRYDQIQFIKIQQKHQQIYQVALKGKDQKDDYQFTGLLTFAQHIGLYLLKVYEHRETAGYIGLHSNLIYEGQKDGDQFFGEWYFKGYQKSNQDSGHWKMNPRNTIS